MQHLWQIIDSGKTVVSTTAQGLWNGAVAYFRWCDSNPIITKKTIMVGKDAGKKIDSESIRPYSIKALCAFCGIEEDYLSDIKRSKKKDSDYYIVVSRILYCIYTQNLELSMTGVFNPIITSKILGLDSIDDDDRGLPVTVNIVQGLPPLSNSENEVLENLYLEKGEIVKKEF